MKSKNLTKLFYFIFMFLLLSCNKSVEHNHWTAEIFENKINSLPELFNQIGTEKLLDIIANKDSARASSFNKMKANQIASYFNDKYNIDIRDKFVDNPEGIVILGMFYAEKEYQDAKSLIKTNSTNSFKTSDENMSCLLAAVGGVIGVTQAKQIWQAIVAGATEETIVAAVSLIGKRVATIWAVSVMVYEIGGCLEWW